MKWPFLIAILFGVVHGQGISAIRVYGQMGSFVTSVSNSGGVTADSLNAPSGVFVASSSSGVFVNSSGVFVADDLNNRVLFYFGNSTTAIRVYGQGEVFFVVFKNVSI
jgi:hypothetical protein